MGQRNTKIKQVTRTEKDFGIAVAPFLKAAALRQHKQALFTTLLVTPREDSTKASSKNSL